MTAVMLVNGGIALVLGGVVWTVWDKYSESPKWLLIGGVFCLLLGSAMTNNATLP